MSNTRFKAVSVMATASIAALSWAALVAPAVAAEGDAPTATVEEIVVTAQKREQVLQDVPLAVSAFSDKALDRAQIEDAADLQFSVPNAVLTGGDRFTLRGIGTNALGSSDLGVQSFVNGSAIGYLPQNELFDMTRVEVLRGPQGTLYGRNTTGGAINLITRKPGHTAGGEFNIQADNYSSIRLGGAFDAPLSDKVAVRVAGYYLKRDGYTENLSTGHNIDGRDQWSIRSTIVFDLGPHTTASLVFGRYAEDSSRAREGKRLCKAHPVLGCDPRMLGFDSPDANTTILQTLAKFFTPFPAGGNIYAGAPNPTDLRKVAADTDPTYKLDQNFAILNVDHDFGAIKLSAIAAYSDSSTEQNTDWDNADLPFRFTTPITYHKDRNTVVTTDRLLTTDSYTAKGSTYTGELRLASSFDGRFNFLVGVFGLSGRSSGGFETWHPAIESYQRALGRPEETWHVSALSRNGRSDTWALFGETYFKVSDTVRLTFGARYTDEKRSGESRSLVLSGLLPWTYSEFAGHKMTGKAAIDWTPDLSFTDKTLIYASVSTGYKGGGLNNSNSAPTYGPETVTAYELGAKNTLLDGRLQANLAAFYYDYSGLQLGQRINGGVVTRNADARIYGLEAEFTYVPTEHVLLDANLSYLHTEIGDFFSEDAANPAQSLTATTPTVQVNLKGNQLPHSPDAKIKIGAQYMTSPFVGDWTATFRADGVWQDKYFAREYNTPTDRIDAWGELDLQIRLDNEPDKMSLRFFVKNVTDEDNITNIIIEDALIGRYRNARLLEPRTFGVIFDKKF
jgi:iron complex outermembrane receptor protein